MPMVPKPAKASRAPPVGEREASTQDLVYAVSASGHRQSYLDLLGGLFGLTPIVGAMTPRMFARLSGARRLLFATLDDDMASFGAVALARCLAGHRTGALFLRAEKCFEKGPLKFAAKRLAFRTLRRAPGLTMATITPFSVAPRYGEVSNLGVCDPQYWDLLEGGALRAAPSSVLAREVLSRANGRRVLCAVGGLGSGKGFGFLAQALKGRPEFLDAWLIVAAGRVHPDSSDDAKQIGALGAMVVDRFLTDQELESLYGASDAIWACYAPEYDQASGVFGRAIQWGVPPIVRSGSVIEAFSRTFGLRHRAVAYGSCDDLEEALADLHGDDLPDQTAAQRLSLIKEWRSTFVETLGAAMG